MQRAIRDLTIYLNDGTLKDLIAAHLYAITVVRDDEEVLELSLSEPENDIRAVRFKLIKNKEVEVIVHS